MPSCIEANATTTGQRCPDRELEASADECPDRELEASAEEYPDKELKASAIKELDPPGRDAPIANWRRRQRNLRNRMNSIGVFLTVRDRVIRVRGVRDYMNRLGIG